MRSNPDFPQTGHRYYHRVTFSNSFLLSNNISRLRQLSIFIVLVVFHRSHRRKIKKQNLFSQWPISQRLYCWNYSFFFFFLSASYFCFLISFRANKMKHKAVSANSYPIRFTIFIIFHYASEIEMRGMYYKNMFVHILRFYVIYSEWKYLIYLFL